jgi:2-polyprenyl-3-methyl-5-hydroxy-6-metoxy-1,4-benzoquinol methylase
MNKAVKFWDRFGKKFDRDVHDERTHYRESGEFIAGLLGKESDVLDVGCATGVLACTIAGSVKSVRGIDLSQVMIAQAKERAARWGLGNISFEVSTIEDLGNNAEKFDAVLAWNVLHLLDGARDAVDRIARLLVPGGLFISSTPGLSDKPTPTRFLFRTIARLGFVPGLKPLKEEELCRLLETSGFAIREVSMIGKTPSIRIVAVKQ